MAPRLLDLCVPVGASDVLVERTKAFRMSVLRSVPLTSWLNGPQRFGFVCSSRCLGCFGLTHRSVLDVCVTIGASDGLVERTPAFWMSVLRSVPQTSRLRGPPRFGLGTAWGHSLGTLDSAGHAMPRYCASAVPCHFFSRETFI